MVARIILTRHGHVDGIEPPRFRGRMDIALTALGVAQANAAAQRIGAISRPAAIYTSPMSRCITTGEAIAKACSAPARVLYQLNELDYGLWQWKTHDEIRTAFAEQCETWHTAPQLFRFPQGESLQDLVARAADALRDVLRRQRDQTVVLRIAVEPCGITEIEFVGNIATVVRANETQQLDAIQTATDRTKKVSEVPVPTQNCELSGKLEDFLV